MILMPPAVPSPSIGGAPKMLTIALGTCRLNSSFSASASFSADSDGIAAILEVVEHQIHGAEVGRVGAQEDRLPGDGDGVLDPRRLEGDFLQALDDLAGARDRCRIGHLHVDEQVALVLLRNETGRRTGEAQPGQDQQTAIHPDHDQADRKEPGDRARVGVRRPVEGSVERLEKMGQQSIHRFAQCQEHDQRPSTPRPGSAPIRESWRAAKSSR